MKVFEIVVDLSYIERIILLITWYRIPISNDITVIKKKKKNPLV